LQTIGRRTGLELGVVTVVLTGVAWIIALVAGVQGDVALVQRDILELRMDLNAATSDRWLGRDMAGWVSALRAANPALQVPEVQREH